jgi:hypothetical protein
MRAESFRDTSKLRRSLGSSPFEASTAMMPWRRRAATAAGQRAAPRGAHGLPGEIDSGGQKGTTQHEYRYKCLAKGTAAYISPHSRPAFIAGPCLHTHTLLHIPLHSLLPSLPPRIQHPRTSFAAISSPVSCPDLIQLNSRPLCSRLNHLPVALPSLQSHCHCHLFVFSLLLRRADSQRCVLVCGLVSE